LNPDTPQTAPAAVVVPLDSFVQRLNLDPLFPKGQPLEVELGSGDGSFLTQYAGLRRDRNFIGVERLLGRLRKTERKCNRLGLTNVRLVRIEASYFLEYLLPGKSAEAVHIYFPDPWPKRKHRKNRLVNTRFPQLAQAALVAGGCVYLRTDDEDYFTEMKRVFGARTDFKEIATPEEMAGVLTDFERGFLKRGVQTLRAAWQLTTG